MFSNKEKLWYTVSYIIAVYYIYPFTSLKIGSFIIRDEVNTNDTDSWQGRTDSIKKICTLMFPSSYITIQISKSIHI